MISSPLIALELIEHHERLLFSVHQAREDNFTGRRWILCDRLRWVDRKNIKLDFKTREVMFQGGFRAVGEP